MFPTASRPLFQRWPTPRTAKTARWGLHGTWPGSEDSARAVQDDACPCRHRASSWRVLLSSAAPRDSQPGHTELIWLQVCFLTKTARFSHDISPLSCRLAAPFLPQAENRQLSALPGSRAGTATALKRLPLRYSLPWNAVIPLAPGEMRAEEVPAVRPGPWLLLKVHLLGLLQSLPQPSGQ